MNGWNFLQEFLEIEKKLIKLDPNFDKRQGFLNLIKNLKKKGKINQNQTKLLLELWRKRNEIVGSPFGINEIDNETLDKLNLIKQQLKIN